MPTVYKLINPLNGSTYYVGFTEKENPRDRLLGHLATPSHPTTMKLIHLDIIPLLGILEQGDHVTKETETFWIKKLYKEGEKLENIEGTMTLKERKTLFDLPLSSFDGGNLSNEEIYNAAIEAIIKEMPVFTSIPIMIRIVNILKWAKPDHDYFKEDRFKC